MIFHDIYLKTLLLISSETIRNFHNSPNVYFTTLAGDLDNRMQESLKKINISLPYRRLKLVNNNFAYIENFDFKDFIIWQSKNSSLCLYFTI